MPNVAATLDERLTGTQARLLERASEVCSGQGIELYLVGGAVRDMLLGLPAIDLDLSIVSADPAFASVLASGLGGSVVASSQFGTFKLRVGDTIIDLAMARTERYAEPGALPDVAPGSIDEDIARRDFSINSMAIALGGSAWGDLLDHFDGRADLERGLIRVLHHNSFVDDATRVVRAIRYAGRLDFKVEDWTRRLLARDLSRLDTIKGDRLRHELERVFDEPRAAPVLRLMRDTSVLGAIHSSLEIDDSTLARIDELPQRSAPASRMVMLSLLTYAAPSGASRELARRLNMDSRWARVVRHTAALRDALTRLSGPGMKPSQIYELLHTYDPDAIRACSLVASEPLVSSRLRLYLSELRHVTPALDGNDLISLGATEGPAVGELLRSIRIARMDGLLKTRSDEIGFARAHI